MFSLVSKWPLVRQIREHKDGTGLESMSDMTRAMHARIDDAQVARSICPYCGVGCGQLIYHKDGKLISIEGDPESPISQGNQFTVLVINQLPAPDSAVRTNRARDLRIINPGMHRTRLVRHRLKTGAVLVFADLPY